MENERSRSGDCVTELRTVSNRPFGRAIRRKHTKAVYRNFEQSRRISIDTNIDKSDRRLDDDKNFKSDSAQPSSFSFDEEAIKTAKFFSKTANHGWNIDYELPSDPGDRERWINGVKNASARGEKTDPFQFFEVKHAPCYLLKVRVLRGRDISKGRFKDMLDTPDPYVIVHIRSAPDGKKATRHIDNTSDPEWNEELTYLLPSDEGIKIMAEIHLMDSNYAVDETYGSVEFDVSSLPLETNVPKTFSFHETSQIDVEFYKEVKCDPDLRSSLALCDEEKAFRSSRKRFVHAAMKKLMERRDTVGPRVLREVPTIAVLGSGGGFRAMTGYSGAIKALHESGILDCCTYVSGLSGSSWYLATLYANDCFPQNGTDDACKEIRNNIQNSPFWLLKPECLLRYSHRLRAKMKAGQPVTFVDFFGMLIGQTLLGAKKLNEAKLTDFQDKIRDGKAPMPLLTCLHVKPKTSAMTFHAAWNDFLVATNSAYSAKSDSKRDKTKDFINNNSKQTQDWVEFTPYEVGMPKYGTFMKTQHFGSKFFMGVLAKQFDESPLHFLMGVWGSAFSILFNRLVEKSKANDKHEPKSDDIRKEMEEELKSSITQGTSKDEDSNEESDSEDDDDLFEDALEESVPLPSPITSPRRKTWFGTPTPTDSSNNRASEKRPSMFASLWSWATSSPQENNQERQKAPPKNTKGFFNSIVGGFFGANIMESREYRAGKVLNYMRGVSLNKTYPLSPFTPLKDTIAEGVLTIDGEFQQLHEPIEVKQKRVHLVDSGLTFNSPYPAMLRPQRAVDLIISFDFSARPAENCEPFKEILLAEKWAKIHHLPFPKIDRTVYEKEGMKECYVFKDESNDRAPVIIHFVLCNIQFRKYSAPGVRRKHGDKMGEFNIFKDPKSPYSTFNFQYSNEAFDRLHQLMEFNTKLHVDTILHEMSECVKLLRHSKARGSVTLSDIRQSFHLSAKSKISLEKTILTSGEKEQIIPIL